MNNPEGYVLVQVKQLAQWREWANNVAAWSTKADRSSEVARLKASISNAMISANQPTASNAGERDASIPVCEFHQCAQWIRSNYQDHATIDGLCAAMIAALASKSVAPPVPEQVAQGASIGWVAAEVVERLRAHRDGLPVNADIWPDPIPAGGVALYTATTPAPAGQDKEDAENYRWLADALTSDDPEAQLSKAFDRLGHDHVPTREDFDTCIRAARGDEVNQK